MYGLKGERQLMEWEVDWLPGYENSRPVRIGNAASGQMQLDIYGEMLDSFFHAQHEHGAATPKTTSASWCCCWNIWRPFGSDPDRRHLGNARRPQQFT